MVFSKNEKEILMACVGLEQFSLSEILPKITRFPCEYSAGTNYKIVHDSKAPLLLELTGILDFFHRLQSENLLELDSSVGKTGEGGYFTTRGVPHEEANVLLDRARGKRYRVTEDLRSLVARGFSAEKEPAGKREARLQLIKDWLPLAISVLALLGASLPSWINLLKNEPQSLNVTLQQNTVQDTVNNEILDRLQVLERKVDYLNSRGQVYDR
jgi:hypothetical protein